MATKTTDTTNDAGGSPCTPEAHQRADFQNHKGRQSGYSRAQAIEDGDLIALSCDNAINDDAAYACSVHFQAPVAVTPAVYDEMFYAVLSGRYSWDEIVGDVMWLASPRETVKIGLQHVFEVVIVKGERDRLRADWRLVVSAGDAGEMVITIMTQDDFLHREMSRQGF
jgi:hypothetical protein